MNYNPLFLSKTKVNVYVLFPSSGAAQKVRVFSPSATSLLIRWGHLRPYFLPDAVHGYEISITNINGVTTKINVSALANEVQVTGLKKYSTYCITVRALTEEGYGSESDEICVSTAEDGKNRVKINFNFTKCISSMKVFRFNGTLSVPVAMY